MLDGIVALVQFGYGTQVFVIRRTSKFVKLVRKSGKDTPGYMTPITKVVRLVMVPMTGGIGEVRYSMSIAVR